MAAVQGTYSNRSVTFQNCTFCKFSKRAYSPGVAARHEDIAIHQAWLRVESVERCTGTLQMEKFKLCRRGCSMRVCGGRSAAAHPRRARPRRSSRTCSAWPRRPSAAPRGVATVGLAAASRRRRLPVQGEQPALAIHRWPGASRRYHASLPTHGSSVGLELRICAVVLSRQCSGPL